MNTAVMQKQQAIRFANELWLKWHFLHPFLVVVQSSNHSGFAER